MQERRNVQRKNLMAYTQVFDLHSGYLLGYLSDLHLQGAMVIGNTFLMKNAELTLAIEIPNLPNINVSRMIMPARIAWQQQDISPEFFNTGFEFKEVSPNQKELMSAIIKKYEFRRDAPKYPLKSFLVR